MDGDELPLAQAKMAVPRARAGLVERRHVLRFLDASEHTPLTLVAAPAGYGKTTAVRAWCAAHDAAVAWVTLDPGDNDPVRLWRYVATAVDRNCHGWGREALRALDGRDGSVQRTIDELMNGIGQYENNLVIVLDDLHTVKAEPSLKSIDYAVHRLSANARLIVLTRIDPALSLARMRADGALAELRADDLAFTSDEAEELLVDRMGIALERDEVEVLRNRTEGWPAAMFLAGYSGCAASMIRIARRASSAATTASSPTTSAER